MTKSYLERKGFICLALQDSLSLFFCTIQEHVPPTASWMLSHQSLTKKMFPRKTCLQSNLVGHFLFPFGLVCFETASHSAARVISAVISAGLEAWSQWVFPLPDDPSLCQADKTKQASEQTKSPKLPGTGTQGRQEC